MKILILFCGGTLVMKEDEWGVLLPQEKNDAINTLLNIEPKLKKVAKLDVAYIDNIDSTNINPKHWGKIIDAVVKNYEKYDGFVITHGTDTMAYTSSALSYALQNLGKPVVLTGAQISGFKMETDARVNFINAVRVAIMDLAGVMLVFNEEIILGSRASKVSESKLNAFKSVGRSLLGEIRADIRLDKEHKKRHNGLLKLKKGFESHIIVVTLFPGMQVSVLDSILDNSVKGLIFRGYGPGNIPYEYLPVIKRAVKLKIPIVVDSQCLEGSTSMQMYDVGKQALEAGVIQAYDMTIESVTTKLMWALKHFPYEEIRDIMHKNYTGEINKEGKIY